MSRGGVPRESILDFSKHIDKQVRVKFLGGREVVGVLKGYDPLVNIVLDETEEFILDPEHEEQIDISKAPRKLGLVVCRGPAVMTISPMEGRQKINNPFTIQQE